MFVPVTGEDLRKPLLNVDRLAIRSSSHVGIRDRIHQQPAYRRKLRQKLIGQSPVPRLDRRARVMGDQPAHELINLGDVSQKPSTVKLVHPSRDQVRRIPHVMQPGGGNQRDRILANQVRNRLSLTPNTLTMRPPPRDRLAQQPTRKVTGTFDLIHMGRLTNVPKDGAIVATCRCPPQPAIPADEHRLQAQQQDDQQQPARRLRYAPPRCPADPKRPATPEAPAQRRSRPLQAQAPGDPQPLAPHLRP